MCSISKKIKVLPLKYLPNLFNRLACLVRALAALLNQYFPALCVDN